MDVDLPIYEDDEEDQIEDEAHTITNAPLSNSSEHIRCIVKNKIELISEHPLTVGIARTLQQHKEAIMKIVFTAARKAIDDINADWIRNQLESNFQRNDWKTILNCRSYLLDFARYAALDGQAQKISDTLRAKKYRMLRVDEVDGSGHERSLKRTHFGQENEDEEEEDPYLRHFACETSLFSAETLSPSTDFAELSEFHSPHFIEGVATPEVNRRQQLRDEFSSRIGFVTALGGGSNRNQISNKNPAFENDRYETNENYAFIERSEEFVKQRKKRTTAKQLNNRQNNNNKNRQLDSEVIQSALNMQKAVIRSATCAVEHDGSFDVSYVEPAFAAGSQFGSNVNKSCLKKANRSNRTRRIRFSDDVNFDKRSSGEYIQRSTKSRTGQNRTNFITHSFDNLSIDSTELNKNGIILPNCDIAIKPVLRSNPMVALKGKVPTIKKGITDEFYFIMKRSFYSKKISGIENASLSPMLVSRVLITDSMLSSLDCDIFRNMDVMKLDYPRMPMWFLETLDEWFADNKLDFRNGGVCFFSKVFILLGLDLLFYYADPTGDQIKVYVEFLGKLVEWFEAKLDEIKSVVTRRERGTNRQKRHSSVEVELFYKKPFGNKGEYDVVPHFKLVQIPTFVIITIPEIGGWKRYFAQLNKCLRDFVQESSNSQFFDLLDWAELVKSAPPESVRTAAERALLLVNVMHREHGVFYV